jgi:transposase-like protein
MEKRRKFTREFKLEAVRLMKDRGVSYARRKTLTFTSRSCATG